MNKKTYTGLNIQWPISEEILSGKKSIETRTYPIPDRYLNQELILIETPGRKGRFKSRARAIVKFTDCFKYRTKKEFYADYSKHFVDKQSDWAWTDKPKWGWQVEVIRVLKKPVEIKKRKGIIFTKNIRL